MNADVLRRQATSTRTRAKLVVVKGLAEETGPVGVACAGIAVYAGLHSLLFEIL